jgi:hypothetical protein
MVWDRSTGLPAYLARQVLEVSAQKKTAACAEEAEAP